VAKIATVLRYFFVELLRLVNRRRRWSGVNTGCYRLGRRKYFAFWLFVR